MLPIILCEDNTVQLQHLTTIIQNYVLFHDNFKHALSADNPKTCLDFVIEQKIENGVYFLDIDLNAEMNGIDLAVQIRRQDVQANIIFVTTHDEFAPLTLKRKVEALAFIDKNETIEQLRDEIMDSLNLANQRSQQRQVAEGQNFSFTVGSRIFNLDLRDVLLITSAKISHQLVLYTKNGQYEFYGKLNDYAHQYPQLFRSSKSALINVQNVLEYDIKSKQISFGGSLKSKCALTKTKELKRRLLGS